MSVNQTKQNDKAIVTICIGKAHESIFKISRPTLENYANKIGADFVVIDKPKISTTSPHYEKFQLYDILTKYRRIIYLDCDLIVRPDCPDLFEKVPEDKIGIFNEGKFKDNTATMKEASRIYNIPLDDYKGDYYNTGVIVFSRMHRDIWEKPVVEDIYNHFEQSYMNLILLSRHAKITDLTYRYNRMKEADEYTGEHRLNCYIIHYAGILQNTPDIMGQDLERWEDKIYQVPKHVILGIGARLGDIISAEPVIRHMVYKEFDEDTVITILSTEPQLFAHMAERAKIYHFKDFQREPNMPYRTFNCMEVPEHPIWNFMTANTMHTVDFMSILCMKHTLPDSEKQIKLPLSLQDLAEVLEIIPLNDPQKLVAVHPGRGWPSKTFPAKFWEEIINKLLDEGYQVAVIGKETEDGKLGTVDIKVPDGATDMRELLSIGGMVALISRAGTLISNDSSPVHAAGAFDNNIIMIPTCKNPDFVMPWRNLSKQYKTKALFGKPMWEDQIFNPMLHYGYRLKDVPPGHNIEEYLPKVSDIIRSVEEMTK